MIYIDFFGGLHGHFLEYSLNALADNIKQYVPFTKFGTSHNPMPKFIATANHYSTFKIKIPCKSQVISLVANPEDCLLVNLLNFARSGDYNFDLDNFEKDFANQVRGTQHYQGFYQSLLHYGIDISKNETVPRGVLRESLKYNFSDARTNSLMQHVYNMEYLDCSIIVHFRLLYNFENYVKVLQDIIVTFNLPYKIDYQWYANLHHQFLEKNQCLNQEMDAIDVLENVVKLQQRPIKLNVIQEAWLNAELERLYNKEMPFNQEQYFLDTDSVNRYLERLS